MNSKLLDRNKTSAKVGISYSTFHRLEKLGQFPKRRRLSPGRVGWLDAELEEWITDGHKIQNSDSTEEEQIGRGGK